MITLRRSAERGHANIGWLDSYFSFSFAGYYDPKHMGFRSLRVINDDRIEAGQGFGPHAHRDMEIITYMVEGKLRHRDSMGEQHVLGPNEIQTMSAGTGIVHSEFNASNVEQSHSIQIWIEPSEEDVKPSYQQIAFDPAEKHGRLKLLAAPEAGATVIHQDARLYVSELIPEQKVEHILAPQRHAWIQVVSGDVVLNGQELHEGDGAAVSEETSLSFAGSGSVGGEFLLFDLA
jgi:redox-sensitive bicupin YhaK (pirin superfamily)